MNIDNFFYSGIKFSEDEYLLKFKFKMLNSMLAIGAFFTALFSILSDLGINDIGPAQTTVNYFGTVSCILLIFYLREAKSNFKISALLLITVLFFDFVVALLYVPEDEFRIMWFYILTYVSFVLLGSSIGMTVSIISIGTILISNYFIDLELSQLAMNSSLIGLFIFTLLSRVYSNKISEYEKSLHRKNEELQRLATTDGLTGIINRRYFDQVSNKYFETAQRYNNYISLLVIDLDYFKKVNDTYGHGVGDQLLIAFVERIKPFVRKSDLFARVGGEEFAILLFNTAMKDAVDFAEKVCKETRDIKVDCKGKELNVTVSIGVSQNRTDDKTFDAIYLRSDNALYKAKDEGRDRVCVL